MNQKPLKKRYAKRKAKSFARAIKHTANRTDFKISPNATAFGGSNPARALVFKGTGFPDRLTTNLVYTDSFILVPAVGTPMPFKTYRLNGVFDPDQALGGGQPQYYDQMALIYRRYCVNGAKVTAMYSRTSASTAGVGPYICGITCSNASGLAATAAATQIQTPNTTYDVLAQDDGTRTIVATYSKKAQFPDVTDSVTSLNNTTPVTQWLANIFVSPQGVDAVAPVNVILKIEYNVTFSEILPLVDA